MEILEKKHEQESKKNNEIYESKLRMMENQVK